MWTEYKAEKGELRIQGAAKNEKRMKGVDEALSYGSVQTTARKRLPHYWSDNHGKSI